LFFEKEYSPVHNNYTKSISLLTYLILFLYELSWKFMIFDKIINIIKKVKLIFK
jgi:hypothetical protein